MDQSTEEALRQEVAYLRQKLQSQAPIPTDQDEKIKELETEIERQKAVIEGKLLNITQGDVLLIDDNSLFDHPDSANTWNRIAKKFGISIISLPNDGLKHLAKASDEVLKDAGLKKIKPLEPYAHLDELMHYLQAQLDGAKNINHPEYVNLIKGGMSQVFEAMECMKLLTDFKIQDAEPVQSETSQ